jgi:hypothetical protein
MGYGETFDLGLHPEGEYELTVHTSADPDTVIAALGDVSLRTDAVTTVTAVVGDQGELGFVVDAKHAVAPPTPSPGPSPKAVRTPSRVETGGGGTAHGGNDALLAGIALAPVLVVAAAARTRASAA